MLNCIFKQVLKGPGHAVLNLDSLCISEHLYYSKKMINKLIKRAEPKQEGQVPELSLVAHMSGMHSYQAKGTCPKSSGIT